MESVVNAFGDSEELWRAIDNDPAHVNSEPTDVRQQRAKHLGHTTASSRRVHVPDGPSVQPFRRAVADPARLHNRFFTDDRQEAIDRLCVYLYFLHAD